MSATEFISDSWHIFETAPQISPIPTRMRRPAAGMLQGPSQGRDALPDHAFGLLRGCAGNGKGVPDTVSRLISAGSVLRPRFDMTART